MSIENEIRNLSEVIEKLIVVISNQQSVAVKVAAPAPVAEAPKPAPVIEAPKPVPVVEVPKPAPVAEPVMPPLPVFEPISPVKEAMKAQQESVPFSDSKGLIDYVMKAYKELGVQKGAEIQKVLVQCGYQNINEVRPESYYGIYRGVEALRAG